MTRTTLDLDPSILRELKRRGAREQKSMGALASELLARSMAGDVALAPRREFRWISRDLGRPIVDLEDKEAVSAILDGRR